MGSCRPARRHRRLRSGRVVPASPLASNDNVTVRARVRAGGAVVMRATGPVVSCVNDDDAGVGSTLPAASIARTSNVRVPSATPDTTNGLEHAANAAASTRHWNVAPVSPGALNANVAAPVGAVGALVIVVFGGVASDTVTTSVNSDEEFGALKMYWDTAVMRVPSASGVSKVTLQRPDPSPRPAPSRAASARPSAARPPGCWWPTRRPSRPECRSPVTCMVVACVITARLLVVVLAVRVAGTVAGSAACRR